MNVKVEVEVNVVGVGGEGRGQGGGRLGFGIFWPLYIVGCRVYNLLMRAPTPPYVQLIFFLDK